MINSSNHVSVVRHQDGGLISVYRANAYLGAVFTPLPIWNEPNTPWEGFRISDGARANFDCEKEAVAFVAAAS